MTTLLDHARAALSDRYPVELVLGEGGAAVVFLAEDRKHNRRVAVKVLRPEVAAALGDERFLREIEFAARLSHPHILTLIDSGSADGLLYYVIPYVETGSLRKRLTNEGRLPIDEAVHITRAVATALDYAHRAGVVHRDIKPENILLQDGVPIVADFGIATALMTAGGVRLTATGLAVGTPAYMSPEQVVGDAQLDGRSDLYSLGCVLYEMLAGEPAFSGPSAQAIIGKRFTEPEPRVIAARSEVSPEIEDVICRAMAKDAANRFATGAELAQALAATGIAAIRASTRHEKSLAVLPFVNLSADPENEYFSDGVTEEIMSALAQVPRLRITARTSAFAFKGANSDVREIGRKLNVGHVLEGSVRRMGQRIRITAQLIDVAAGYQLWSERYDRELQDIFAVQDEIAARITGRLKTEFAPAGGRRERSTRDLDAYDAYLRGRFDWNKGTLDSYRRSIQHYQRAIELDVDYAEAHLGIAETLCYSALLGADPIEIMPRMRAAVAKALELDDRLPEAHATLGYIKFWFDWQWVEAERHMLRAIELGPSSATAHNYYSVFLANLGRAHEAVEQGKQTIALDPLWVNAHQSLSWALFQAGRYVEAIAASDRALELVPAYVLAHVARGMCLLELGSHDEALASFVSAVAASSGNPLGMAGMAQSLARMGRREEARQVLREMQELSRLGSFLSSAVAWGHCALGELDEAAARLPQLVAARDIFVVCLPSFSWWDPVRSDPRFREVLEQVAFPAWAKAVSDARRRATLPIS